MAWKADQLQGVIFPIPGSPQIDALGAWKIITSDAPFDSFNRAVNTPFAQSQAEGSFGDYQLTVAAQLGRVTLVLSGKQPEQPTPTEPILVNDVDDAASVISRALRALLPSAPPVRISLVAMLNEIVSDHSVSARRLTELTGGVWFPDPAVDSIYQVNIRRVYSESSHIMNRVVTWGAATLQTMSAIAGPQGFPNLVTGAETPVVTLKLDINSATAVPLEDSATGMVEDNLIEFGFLSRDAIGRLR